MAIVITCVQKTHVHRGLIGGDTNTEEDQHHLDPILVKAVVGVQEFLQSHMNLIHLLERVPFRPLELQRLTDQPEFLHQHVMGLFHAVKQNCTRFIVAFQCMACRFPNAGQHSTS